MMIDGTHIPHNGGVDVGKSRQASLGVLFMAQHATPQYRSVHTQDIDRNEWEGQTQK